MYKTNVKTDIYCANIYKHGYERNMTKLWCKIMPKVGVEHTKGNERSFFYLYPFEDLIQGSF